MWESGGQAPWSACDENNYTGWATASCTQRGDGQLYADLGADDGSDGACPRDNSMTMTATTAASWTTGPMKCAPVTTTAAPVTTTGTAPGACPNAAFDTCGGEGQVIGSGDAQWSGETCCQAGLECVQESQWYHVCKSVRRMELKGLELKAPQN